MRKRGVSIDPATFSKDSETAALEQTAAAFVEAGLSIIPIKNNGSKAPAFPWKSFQSRRPNPTELHKWFNNGSKFGLAVVAGEVSGSLEVLDFDNEALFEPWQELVEESGEGLIEKLPTVLTPRGGYHFFYRCEEIEGNQKLAQRNGENGRPEVMIETRAEGGYVLLPGSPPECHPLKEPYILINGSLASIPVISKSERSLLLDAARSFNEASTDNGSSHAASNPNAMGWAEILGPYGWSLGPPRSDKAQNWSRPGRSGVVSATTNFNDSDRFHAFSTNSGPFEAGRFYTKSEAYTLLNPNEISEGWPDLEPLPILLPTAPPLDPALLPKSLAPWIEDESERMQVPLEMIAIPALIALGSIVGRALGIYPKKYDSWLCVPNLWGGVIARPGMMKSPAQVKGLRPIECLANEATRKYKQDLIESAAEGEVFKARIKEVKDRITASVKEVADCTELQKELASILREQSNSRLIKYRYLSSDPTIEKLGELLRDNPNGILLARDELSGWLRSLEKDGREGSREFFMESWSGDGSYTFDRIGRGEIYIPSMTLSICGSLQPGKLNRYVHEALEQGWADDGMLQRFQLLVWPETPPNKWKNVDRRPDRKAYERALGVYRRLDKLKERVQLLDDIPALHFDSAAQIFFDLWHGDLEKRLRSDEMDSAALCSHLSKFRSLMPSLSLLIHLSDTTDLTPVTLDAAFKAAELCDYFEAHALKVYAGAINPDLQAAHALTKKIKHHKIMDKVPVRDLYRNQWSGLTTPASVRSGLRVLEEYGWLRLEDVETTRKPIETVRLNPALKESLKK